MYHKAVPPVEMVRHIVQILKQQCQLLVVLYYMYGDNTLSKDCA